MDEDDTMLTILVNEHLGKNRLKNPMAGLKLFLNDCPGVYNWLLTFQ